MAEESVKKRKRQTDGTSRPNKKHATQSSEPIRITHLKEDGLHPVVVSSNSIKSPSFSFDAYAKDSRDNRHGELANPATHDIILHSSKHPRLEYTAAPPLSGKLAHYIAAYDSRTHSLKIIPAHHAQIRAVLRVEPPAESPRKTAGQQRIALGQEFGTKKAKKIIASRAQNAISNAVSGQEEQIQNAILADIAEKAPEIVSEKDELQTRLATKPIPQPNLAAETVEDIYPLNVLIPPADMKNIPISDWQEQSKDKKEGVQGHNRMPMYRVQAVIDGGDTTKLKALRYAALLLQFNGVLIGNRETKTVPKKDKLRAALNEYPDNLVDSVVKRFSQNFTLSKFQIERLHTHICALSLYVDDYTTDISHLRDDLKVEPKKIAAYFNELGCRIRAINEKEKMAMERRDKHPLNKAFAASIKIAVLKCPPDFPKPKFIRRK